MSFRSITQAGAFSLSMLLGFAAQAATLDPIQGGILVSRAGGPYQTVSQPVEVRVGDTVLANPGGLARVVYENGCAAEVRPGMVFMVSEPPPCQTGSNPDYYGSTKDGVVTTDSTDYTAIAVGAAVVAGGVGIALAVSGGGGGGGGSP